ncbi:MAG: FISUMP domain-containing protein [Prolixibacteraceae bacterium]
MKKQTPSPILVFCALILALSLSCQPPKDESEPTTSATLTTNDANVLTSSVAILGGNVTSDGNNAVTERGVVYATTLNPTTTNTKAPNGLGLGTFSSSVTGLTEKTTYYVRAYAINSKGTFYGNQVSFTTPAAAVALTVTDADGNVYKTTTVGTQVWMAENLKTTKYKDNTAIANVSDPASWASLSNGAYCWYGNDSSNKNVYGALYNWFANSNGKLCPTGWHLPSYEEWNNLINYLGGVDVAGGKLKASAGWNNNGNGSDSSGFSAMPGGIRSFDGTYSLVSANIYLWSSADNGTASTTAYIIGFSNNGIIYSNFSKKIGMSVRCMKD